MAEKIKVLKGISKGGETYDIDAKYWNGKTDINLKTINGQSLLGNEDIRTNIYCTCDSASNLITKTINISNVSLMDGMHIWINFKNGHDEFVESGDIAIKSNITHAGGTLENVPILFKGINGGFVNPPQNGYKGYYYQPLFGSGIYEFILCGPNTEIPTWTLNFTGSHTSIKEPFIYMKTSTITLSNITNIYSVLREGIHVKLEDTILNQLSVVSDTGLYKSDCSFEFTTGTTAPTLTVPSAWKWANGIVPHITAYKRYHVSVKNNCAVIAEFDV